MKIEVIPSEEGLLQATVAKIYLDKPKYTDTGLVSTTSDLPEHCAFVVEQVQWN